MKQAQAKILWNRPKGPSYFSMGLACDGYAEAVPGQFVMLRVSRQHAPLLRRPFSIHRPVMEGGRCVGIELLYKVVGKGTQLLSCAREGEALDILGPIGNGFRFSDALDRIYLVGGGIRISAPAFRRVPGYCGFQA